MASRSIPTPGRTAPLAQWAFFSGISLIAFLIILEYQPESQPILGDRGYFLYMAQAVQRGEPIYRTTTFGYTPLGILLSAGVMQAAERLGFPALLGLRYFSAAITALSAGLLYLVTTRASRNRWAGLIASFTLIHFDFLAVLTAANLEPKILVQFLTLLMITALQYRRWWLAGAAAGLAGGCWQPALIIAAPATLLAAYDARKRSPASLTWYVVGFLSGSLPLLVYLGSTAQWGDFLQQAVFFKLLPRPTITNPAGALQPVIPFMDILQALRTFNLPFFALALAGFWGQLWRSSRRGRTHLRLYCFHPRFGGLLLLTFTWLAYALLSALGGLEFQGTGDVLPFLYLIAFWAAWGCYLLFVWWARHVAGRGEGSRYRTTLGAVLPVSFAAVILTVAVLRAAQYEVHYTLGEQNALIRSALPARDSDDPLLAINAPEVYVLTGQPSPWRYLHVTPYFLDFIQWKEAAGCPALLQDLKRSEYAGVVIKLRPEYDNACLRQIMGQLDGSYRATDLVMDANLQWCDTTILLKRLVAREGGEVDLRAWATCMLSKREHTYQQTRMESYVVYRR